MTTAATRIRDAIVDRLTPVVSWGKVRKTQLPQLQPTDLPALSVFIMGERLGPDGDTNAGEPRFESETTIGISVVRGFDETLVLDGLMDVEVDSLEATLLSDPTFVRSYHDSVDPPFFESVESITRRRLFPQTGETYFAELRLEMVFMVRVDFPPNLSATLDHVRMTSAPANSGEHTPTISVDIDLTA